jgi:hypothetical protein
MDIEHKRCSHNRLARQIASRTHVTVQIAPANLHVLQSSG